jgi:hypothetical protein
MTAPVFGAEASLYLSRVHYVCGTSWTTVEASIVPQLRFWGCTTRCVGPLKLLCCPGPTDRPICVPFGSCRGFPPVDPNPTDPFPPYFPQ